MEYIAFKLVFVSSFNKVIVESVSCHSQVSQLNTLIGHLLGDLTKGDRQKIMTICTIDVHARDVVAKLIAQKIDNSQAFIWLSQLRHRCVLMIFTHFIAWHYTLLFHVVQLSAGGTMSRGTAMPISVMLSSSTPMSTLATHPDWSSLLSQTGTLAVS